MNKYFIAVFLLLLTGMGRLAAQTNVSAGAVSGTWQKSGSPYRVNGNIYVASGQKLSISSGVVVEFQGNYKMDVWGVIQAQGKAADTVVFTAKDKTNGWTGIWVHKQAVGNDSIIFDYCKIEYRGLQTSGQVPAIGSALAIDSARKVRISNCLFRRNRSDYGAAGIYKFSDLKIYNCLVANNEAYNRRSTDALSPCPGFVIYGCRTKLFACHFIKNYSLHAKTAIQPGGVLEFADSVIDVANCLFKDNRASAAVNFEKTGGILFSKTASKCDVRNCVFVNNRYGIVLLDAARINCKNIAIDSCEIPMWITNVGNILPPSGSTWTFDSVSIKRSGMMIIGNNTENNPMDGTFKRLKYMNSDKILFGVSVDNVVFENSIIANNNYGIDIRTSNNLTLINSIVSNNKPKKSNTQSDSFGSGILLGDFAQVHIYNSIISGNRTANGELKNFEIFYDGSPGDLQLTNSVVEGGKSSIRNLKPADITKYLNVSETAPQFVNPTSGAGPAYDASLADWHPLNSCSALSSTFNAGTSAISGATFPKIRINYKFPTSDLDGNKRIANNLVDIGPYEIQKPRIPVLLAEPRDSSICANQTIDYTGLSAAADSLQYRWQSSSNGSTWTNMTAQTYAVLYNFKPGTAGVYYLRCIISNPLCSKSDTSRSIKVTALPVPQPNLGPDASIANSGSKLLNPGTFNSYTWSTGATTPTLTVDKNNLALGANIIWVQVKDANNCQNRDTVIITLEPASRVESPEMAGIRVYPVPTDGLLNVQLPTQSTGTWQLTTTDGRLLQHGKLEPHTQINTKTLPAGIYLLSMEVEGKVYGMRVLR